MGSRDKTACRGPGIYRYQLRIQGLPVETNHDLCFRQASSRACGGDPQKCLDIQERIAEMLKPGVAPSYIYETIMRDVNESDLPNFMGYGKRRVRFLGHGIGLHVDEMPVLAKGFDEPLQEGMVFAVEPKAGVAGIGMVGIENTFIVTPEGGRCITGDHPGLMKIF